MTASAGRRRPTGHWTPLSEVRQLEEAGGWLLLDGSPATMSGYDELPLDKVFRIYRDACGPRTAVASTR